MCYTWERPVNNDPIEQLVVNLIMLFLKECTEDDHTMLLDEETYLRLWLYQDGSPYVCAYIRSIKECTYPSHKIALLRARHSGEFLPCEISSSEVGYFFAVPRHHWENKEVTFIESFA